MPLRLYATHSRATAQEILDYARNCEARDRSTAGAFGALQAWIEQLVMLTETIDRAESARRQR